MVFLQTSNTPLEFIDTLCGRVNVFLSLQESLHSADSSADSSTARTSKDAKGTDSSEVDSTHTAPTTHADSAHTAESTPTPPSYRYVSMLNPPQASRAQILAQMFHKAKAAKLELEILRKIKLQEINESYQASIDLLLLQTPQAEMQSWNTQESEAKAYKADPNAPTPYIDMLSKARKVQKQQLVEKIIQKAQSFTNLSAKLTGEKQKLEDAITKAQSDTELESIHFTPQMAQSH